MKRFLRMFSWVRDLEDRVASANVDAAKLANECSTLRAEIRTLEAEVAKRRELRKQAVAAWTQRAHRAEAVLEKTIRTATKDAEEMKAKFCQKLAAAAEGHAELARRLHNSNAEVLFWKARAQLLSVAPELEAPPDYRKVPSPYASVAM